MNQADFTGATAHIGVIVHALDDPAKGNYLQHFERGVLIVNDQGYVINVGTLDLLPEPSSDLQIIDHGDCLLMPGFVDTHIHYPQSGVIASYGTQLIDWLNTYTFPAELVYANEEHAYKGARLFIDELLKNGTTTAQVFASVHPTSVDAFFTVSKQHNLRMLCGKVMMDRHAPDDLLDTPELSYEQSADLIERWHGHERLDYSVTPRFAPTSSSEQLTFAGRLLEEYPGVRLHTHLSENPRECEWVKELFPKSTDYLDVYDQHGLVGPHSIFAHSIHLSEREWKRMGEAKSAIAFCPCSNLFIGSGLFDLAKADAHGVQTSFATDVGGGDSFSMLRVINEGYKVLQLNGQNLDAARALYLATLGGAQALGLDDVIGNFKPGKEADFVVVDPRATPLMEHRYELCSKFDERLFCTLMMGDDRAIKETRVMGKIAHQRSV